MAHVIEIHTARLVPGTDAETFRRVNADIAAEILRVPGLLKRELVHDVTTGLWVDIIHWSSAEARETAMPVFAANPHLHGFAKHLDPSTMSTVIIGAVVDLAPVAKA